MKLNFTRQPVAVHLHIFHQEPAIKILARLRILNRVDLLVVSHPNALTEDVAAALSLMRCRVVCVPCENKGRDVLPFLNFLKMPDVRKYDVLCKLHTKSGTTGFGDLWLDIFLERLLGTKDIFKRNLSAFSDPYVMMIGPRELYKDGWDFMFGNASNVQWISVYSYKLFPPKKWGFFAGTMFMARRDIFAKLSTNLPNIDGISQFKDEPIKDNQELPHALERVFGLIPTLLNGKVALVSEANELSVYDAPGPTDSANMTNMFRAMRESMAAGAAEPRVVYGGFSRRLFGFELHS